MSIKQKIKEYIMLRSLRKNIKNNPLDIEEIETYSLPENSSHLDTNSYYFSSHDLEGNSLLIRKAERGDHTLEVWFVLKYKDQIFLNKKQFFTKDTAPVQVSCLSPGKIWEVNYQGDIYEAKISDDLVASPTGKQKSVSLKMKFSSNTDIFDFSYHINPKILAKTLAKQTWDKDFIQNMRENQQRHYEQQGNIVADIKIDNEIIKFNMRAMRDHSFGRRDWSYMNRHIWLMSLIEEEESLNVNQVSYPHMKDLRTGYYETSNETSSLMHIPNLFSLENNVRVPNHMTYDVVLDTGKTLSVTATKEIVINFTFDNESYTICEGICSLDIDGKKGRGIIEFGYNKDKEKWK